jgi:hypothetical protein
MLYTILPLVPLSPIFCSAEETSLYTKKDQVDPNSRCAADAAIWAEQQLVAIPGWLHEDQNARLDQEGHFASIKEHRSPTIKKNKAKRRTITAGEGEQDGDSSHSPPPTPVVILGPRPTSFQKSPRI